MYLFLIFIIIKSVPGHIVIITSSLTKTCELRVVVGTTNVDTCVEKGLTSCSKLGRFNLYSVAQAATEHLIILLIIGYYY